MRKFDSPANSVEAYIHNINSNAAYAKLRELRASKPGATGLVLADGLTKYSERGLAYVKEIKQFIIKNNLIEYDVLNNVTKL